LTTLKAWREKVADGCGDWVIERKLRHVGGGRNGSL
jgi:hypothetical protein